MITGDELGKSHVFVQLPFTVFSLVEEAVRQGNSRKDSERGHQLRLQVHFKCHPPENARVFPRPNSKKTPFTLL